MKKLLFIISFVAITLSRAIGYEGDFDDVVSRLSAMRGMIDASFIEDRIIWLSDNKIDRNLLRMAAWKVFNDSTQLRQKVNATDSELYCGETGQSIMLNILASCAVPSDWTIFESMYLNHSEDKNVRFNAFFAHLFSTNADNVESVIMRLSNHEVFPISLRQYLYSSGICLVYQWSVPDKRKAIAAAFKNVIKYEGDDKWMFLICDDMLKFLYEDYARSEYRRDFIGQFLKTPFNENESKRLKPYFEQAIAECTNPKVKVKPSLEKDYLYPPYISYEETILAGKGIPEIKKMVDEFRNGGDVLQETEKTKQTLSAWTISTTTAFVIVVVVGVIAVWRKIRKRE
ncbi:MAG: hypothetical protein IJU44_03795 [Kiritimatiellae bacterium]|nr:hypothetical protein [Kiritimatiellia bacterium]